MEYRLIQPSSLKQWKIEDERVLIGRSPDSDIVLDHPTVSKTHATIFMLGGKVIVKDLDSTNGTLINGQIVHQQFIIEGDFISFGALSLRFESSENFSGSNFDSDTDLQPNSSPQFETKELKELARSDSILSLQPEQIMTRAELRQAIEKHLQAKLEPSFVRVYENLEEDGGLPDLIKSCFQDGVHFLKKLSKAIDRPQQSVWCYCLPIFGPADASEARAMAAIYIEHERNIPFAELQDRLGDFLARVSLAFFRIRRIKLDDELLDEEAQ